MPSPGVRSQPESQRVLVVEDDPMLVSILGTILTESGIIVSSATTLADGIAAATRGTYDLIITDAFIPPSASSMVERSIMSTALLAVTGDTPVLLCSGHRITDAVARTAGFQGLLAKPFDLEQFDATVRRLLGHAAQDEGLPPVEPAGCQPND